MKGLTAYCTVVFLSMIAVFVLPPVVAAQEQASLYIQTENNLPFAVKWNGKTYTSTAFGSVTIPEVPAGTQTVEITLGAEEAGVFRFTVPVASLSKAFSLRQFVNNGWGLIDLVDLALINGSVVLPATETGALMANDAATSRPALQVNIPVNNTAVPIVKPAEPPVRKQKPVLVTAITRIFERAGSTGVDQVYVLSTDNRSDTIALFIPVLEEPVKEGPPPVAGHPMPLKSKPTTAAVTNIALREPFLLFLN